MARLDFNALTRPVLDLVMMDEAKTAITVTTPTEGLVEELEKMLPNANTIFAADNPDSIDACYDLAARVISCNRQGIAVTVDELKNKYWPKDKMANQLYLLTFFKAYVDYIDELKNEKN